MKSIRKIISLAVLLWSVANSQAASPRARQLEGVIQTMDHQTRQLTVFSEKPGKRLTMVWNRDTTFIRNGQLFNSTSLRKGLRVRVSCRLPFFGKPLATKVVWEEHSK